jgi:hypothetical protein
LAAAFALVAVPWGAAADAQPLFTEAPLAQMAAPAAPSEISVTRSRRARVNFAALAPNDLSTGSELHLNLFEDTNLDAVVTRRVSRSSSSFTVIGSLSDDADASFTMSFEQGVIIANVRSPRHGRFQVRSTGDDICEIVALDESLLPTCATTAGEAVENPDEPLSLAIQGPVPTPEPDDGSLIDVLVVYTPEALAGAGSEGAMLALINLAVDESNAAYEASDIATRLRLVHVAQVNYSESGNFSTDLSRLRGTTDGNMDEVHALRNTHGADLVSLIVNNTQYCGIAYLMTNLSTNFNTSGFSVVSRICAAGNLSFAHELGHNMGSTHDHDNASSSLYAHSFGHRFSGQGGGQYRTVMAYAPGQRIGRFSNPNVLFDGTPTGIPAGQPGEADNAQSINAAAFTVANFRQAAGSFTGTVAVDAPIYSCADSIGIELNDLDLQGVDTTTVTVSTETDVETVTLTEIPSGSGRFLGSIGTSGGAPASGNGLLELTDGQVIQVTYADDDIGGGEPGTSTSTAVADCAPPTFGGLESAISGDGFVLLSWSAAEDDNGPIAYKVYRSTVPGGQSFGAPLITKTNATHVDIAVTNGVAYHYVVRAVDGVGNQDTNTIERSGTPTGPIVLDHFDWSAIGSTQQLGAPFSVTLTAKDGAGNTVNGFEGTATLSAHVGAQQLIGFLSLSETGPFSGGVWTGEVSALDAAVGVHLRAEAAGAISDSGTFDVIAPQLSVSDAEILEGDSGSQPLIFQVTLDASTNPVTVNYATLPGSAEEGVDYAPVTGSLIFPAGVTSRPVTVEVFGDGDPETDESFSLVLSEADGAELADETGEGVIRNDDTFPAITVVHDAITVWEESGESAELTLSLATAMAITAEVTVTTVGQTADAGDDFTSAALRVVFPPGRRTRHLSLTVADDAIADSGETFAVQLSDPLFATLGETTATVTIEDNDKPDDVIFIYLLGMRPLTAAETVAADKNEDGQIDVADLVRRIELDAQH